MKREVRVHTKSVEETMALGEAIGNAAADGLFLALIGDLGTGKTHFVQGLAKGLGITGPVTSPTFNLMNQYEGRLVLTHFDFYRLNRVEELYNIGWEEYSTGGVVVAEWAGLFPEVIPAEALTVTLTRTGDTDRNISITWDDEAPFLPGTVIKEIETYALSH